MGLRNRLCDGCEEPAEALFRANKFGVEGLWYCRQCMHLTDTPIDPEVSEIARIIEDSNINGL